MYIGFYRNVTYNISFHIYFKTNRPIIMILIVWFLLIPIFHIFLVLTTNNIDKDKYELNKYI